MQTQSKSYKYHKYYLTKKIKSFAKVRTTDRTIYIDPDLLKSINQKKLTWINTLESKYNFKTQLNLNFNQSEL